ncbi:hypothetical protein Hanom_Chr01g00043121 [Helianthus anomalus]
MHLGRATRMVMWFHMATVSMQPWRIYPLCLIVYKSEPHNCFITSTTILVYICYVLTGHVFIFYIYIFLAFDRRTLFLESQTDLEFIATGRVNGRFHTTYLKK